MRIASLVPAGTEILFALGLGADVVAVTHECDYPAEARRRPRLTTSVLDTAAMTSGDIDREIAARVSAGLPLYEIDAAVLADARPDLIITQSLCDVCALPATSISAALQRLHHRPALLTLDQRTLDGVIDAVRIVAAAAGVADRGEALHQALQDRLSVVRAAVASRPPVRVVCLEWIDPPYMCGHWIPEMVALAGGIDPVARPHVPSVPMSWTTIAEAKPELIVAFPCGHDRRRARTDLTAAAVKADVAHALRTAPVFMADAVLFTRPGPRVVDGVEALAEIFHGGSSPHVERWP